MNRSAPLWALALCACLSYSQPTCPACSGSPAFACSGGGSPICSSSGTWVCDNGGTQCPAPPPAWNCGSNATIQCTGQGWTCVCTASSCGVFCPLVIDTKQAGFHLTDPASGVLFSFYPRLPVRVAWTDPEYGNGFLVLDRDGNGTIDSGAELFGDLTPQPASTTPNGFAALAVFDQPADGGNADGVIDARDAVYNRLKVWVDANQNGKSEPEELHSLTELGIKAIDLKYRTTKYVDQFGNEFRYRGRVRDYSAHDQETIYDVFLKTLEGGK